jgi:adenosylcobinamide-phosphate synthase
VQLGGANRYFGKVVEKPTIGDPTRPIEPQDILRANRLMLLSSAITLLICIALRRHLLAFLPGTLP